MYYLTRSRGMRLAAQEFPAATVSLVIAEGFYRFHSFTLECLAFLATWYALSWALSHLWALRRQSKEGGSRRG